MALVVAVFVAFVAIIDVFVGILDNALLAFFL